VSVWRYDEYYKKEIRVWAKGFDVDDPKGFLVQLLPPGAYTVKAEAPGYELESPVAVTIERGRQTSGVLLRLKPK